MNSLFTKRFVGFCHKPMVLMSRSVTYEVSPTGEKVVLNKYEHGQSKPKKEKWQQVRPMGYEPEVRQIKEIEFNHRLESDPKKARNTASSRLQELKDSLLNRGFCRETKPYSPPNDVEDIVKNICLKVLSNESDVQKWKDISIEDRFLKYKFLTKCSKQLNYEIPNSMLYLIKTVSDVLHFYSTPIRGITSYDQMVQNSDQLPPNLHVSAEPIRYNPENDTFFDGINAYPFTGLPVRGLRAKKKHQAFKGHFKWPDI